MMKQTTINFEFHEPEIKENKPPKPTVAEPIVQKEPLEVDVKLSSKNSNSGVKSKRGRMKLSDMAATVDRIEIPDDEELFSKSYYGMGAVTGMFKVNYSLIRYWESEFSILKPKKNAKGDRFFRPEDIKNLRLIYHLLRERKYTIDGAKEFLKKNKLAEKKFQMIESLKNLKSFLHELKTGL